MTYFIYKIQNLNNDKIYVGQTTKGLSRRLNQHSYKSSRCIKLLRAITKHGINHFIITLLTITHTKEVSDFWEKHFIIKYDSVKNGYNIRDGGSHGILPLASRQKISEASKKQTNRWAWPKGKNHSSDTKNKISKSLKDRVISPDAGKKISASKLGKKLVIIDGKRFYKHEERVIQ
jgi:group I intron endonuclease